LDLVYQERPPDVARTPIGSRVFTDGFRAGPGRGVARKLSVTEGAPADWPTDTPIALGLDAVGDETHLDGPSEASQWIRAHGPRAERKTPTSTR
jgi:hypothetical protein